MKKLCKYLIITLILFLNIQGVSFSTPSQKKLDSNIDTISLYIYKDYILKNSPYVTYTVRTKDKTMGDFINTIKTECSDMTTGIVQSIAYDKNYYPTYIETENANLEKLNTNSILYNAAIYACNSKDTYTKTKKNASSEKDGIPMKILKGTGQAIGFILVLPFALLGALLG